MCFTPIEPVDFESSWGAAHPPLSRVRTAPPVPSGKVASETEVLWYQPESDNIRRSLKVSIFVPMCEFFIVPPLLSFQLFVMQWGVALGTVPDRHPSEWPQCPSVLRLSAPQLLVPLSMLMQSPLATRSVPPPCLSQPPCLSLRLYAHFFISSSASRQPPKKIWDYTPGDCSILPREDRKVIPPCLLCWTVCVLSSLG